MQDKETKWYENIPILDDPPDGYVAISVVPDFAKISLSTLRRKIKDKTLDAEKVKWGETAYRWHVSVESLKGAQIRGVETIPVAYYRRESTSADSSMRAEIGRLSSSVSSINKKLEYSRNKQEKLAEILLSGLVPILKGMLKLLSDD